MFAIRTICDTAAVSSVRQVVWNIASFDRWPLVFRAECTARTSSGPPAYIKVPTILFNAIYIIIEMKTQLGVYRSAPDTIVTFRDTFRCAVHNVCAAIFRITVCVDPTCPKKLKNIGLINPVTKDYV